MGGNDSQQSDTVKSKTKSKDDTTLLELIMFTLSPLLGGRDQVMATPFIECLKYVELVNQKKVSDRWGNFMDMFYSSPEIDKKKRDEYVKEIQPKGAKRELEMKTDRDQLQRMKDQQNKK